ncbi:MAG: response regulator [Actinoplanes sp.]
MSESAHTIGGTVIMETAPDLEGPLLQILLIEDDADDALLCRVAIGRSNLRHRLNIVGTLSEGIECLDDEHVDVVLVDLSLPDTRDLDAVTVLAERFTRLPIVVLTGLRDERTAGDALHGGAEDYLIKGSSSETIARAIRYAIERKRGAQARRAMDTAEAARLRAEQTARELEHNYRELFDSNPYPMYVFDTGTLALLEVNDAAVRYYGYSRSDLLTLDLTRLVLPEDVAALVEAVATATAVQRWGPIRQVKQDGAVVDVVVTSHVLSFDRREARCAVVEDITEKEQLERRLHQSQRLESLGQLAGGIAHDFNNILGIIIGYATFCAQDMEVAAEADPRWQTSHADLQQILQAGDRATNLIHQLLSFARAEIPETQVIDLNTVVTGVGQLLRRTIGEDIEMQIQLTGDPRPVKADPGQVEQVLVNLAVNARDAMSSGGVLGIHTDPVTIDDHYAAQHPGARAGSYMRLRVSDTGTGMSQATIDRAFEPFFTTKPKGQGTGLGLATIYGIVTQAGGYVQIESAPDAGTTFTVFFPVTQETATARPAETDDLPHPVRNHETILLAEDEDGLRLLTERILTRQGYTVITARDGAEALELAGRHPGTIDLLVTDVIMPQMNGHDLALKMQALRPTMAVLYVSGYAEPLLAFRSTLPLGSTVLSKPVAEQQILSAIRRTLGKRQPDPKSGSAPALGEQEVDAVQ